MKYLILFLVIVSAWHFIYDGIIAPSIRLHLRNKLFILRDELRLAKIDGISSQDEDAFWFVHEGINNFINRLPNLTIEKARSIALSYRQNEHHSRLLDEHIFAVENASDSRITGIFRKTNSVIEATFITNMGGWFIYLIPIAIIFSFMTRLSNLASILLVASKKDIERLLPQNTFTI